MDKGTRKDLCMELMDYGIYLYLTGNGIRQISSNICHIFSDKVQIKGQEK